MMHYRDAFNSTLDIFNISAKSLSVQSGVQERQISYFRNGKKGLMVDTFFDLISALPKEAQVYFFSYILGDSILSSVDIRALILGGSTDTATEIMDLLAMWLRKRKNAETANTVSVI